MATKSGTRHRDFKTVFCVTDVKERKKLLGKVLQIPEFNEEDDLRSGILLDIHYDTLAYFVNNGFPWREVAQLWKVFQNLLNEVQVLVNWSCQVHLLAKTEILWASPIKGKPLEEAITLFKQQLNRIAHYSSENNLKSMIDFVFMTLFQHYKLYQFVLTQERADDITKCELDIEPPLVPQPLRDGVPKSVWDEEQRIKQIEEMEQKCIQERTTYHENEIQQAAQQLEQQFLELDSSPENLSAENLATVVANVTAKKAAVTSATLSYKMEEMHDSLKFKYKRATVSQENDKGGKKSTASSRRSKGNSGK